MNVTTYEVNIQIGEPLPTPDMIAFDSEANAWIGFGRNDDLASAQTISKSNETFLAATDVNGMIFASTANGDLYVPVSYTHLLGICNLSCNHFGGAFGSHFGDDVRSEGA